jgi:hypothetical protein
MTRRILPREEWSRLEQSSLGWLLPHLPEDAAIVIVEDDAHAIVGHLAFVTFRHAHGLWIDPAHRGRAAVLRHLYEGLYEEAARIGAASIWMGAADAQMASILDTLGAVEPPQRTYVWPVVMKES